MAKVRGKRTAEELALEAARCIEECGLTGEQLRLYLAAWISECAVHGDLDAMRQGADLADRRYERALEAEPAFAFGPVPPEMGAAEAVAKVHVSRVMGKRIGVLLPDEWKPLAQAITVVEERATDEEREACARELDEMFTVGHTSPVEAVEWHRKRWQSAIRARGGGA